MLRRALIALGLLAAIACGSDGPDPTDPPDTRAAGTSTPATTTVTVAAPVTTSTVTEPEALGVLVFHKTAGFAHESIPAGIEAFRRLGEENGWEVETTDDAAVFTDADLDHFGVIVFLNTTGDVLDGSQQAAMESFMGDGGGFVGIHSAADTEYEWPWYGDLVGAYFDDHPAPQPATVEVRIPDHPVVVGLPSSFERFDEWYNFRALPDADILATLDEASYDGGTMGDPHPIIWSHDYDGGRSVYTGFGHTKEAFGEPLVLDHLSNAVLWAAGNYP